MKLVLTHLIIFSSVANGFTAINSDPYVQKAGLRQLVDSPAKQKLSLNLDIGNEESGGSRLAVMGLVLDLRNDEVSGCEDIITMPGKHGSHPKLSSGLRKLNVAEEGHFISSLGTEMVSIANSCWEMIWRDNSHSGFLICGLDVAEEYRRNEAKLPKGQTYISFTCWTRETLREVQKSKQRILDRAEKYQKQKQEALARMEATDNIFLKALHYANAYTAAINYSYEPLKGINDVPDTISNVIQIHDDLFVHPTGLVWSQSHPNGKQVVLGSAGLTPQDC